MNRHPKPPPSFTAINQQNIAVMNNPKTPEVQNKNVTNEKETAHEAEAKTLPADTGTFSLPADAQDPQNCQRIISRRYLFVHGLI